MELHLVEEEHLAGLGVAEYRAAPLHDAQIVLAPPLAGSAGVAACFFDYRAVLGSEEALPAHIQALAEVANVHEPLLFELTAYLGIETLVHLAAVHHRSGATLPGNGEAEKVDAAGPRGQV